VDAEAQRVLGLSTQRLHGPGHTFLASVHRLRYAVERYDGAATCSVALHVPAGQLDQWSPVRVEVIGALDSVLREVVDDWPGSPYVQVIPVLDDWH
jgi:hypothetical protein